MNSAFYPVIDHLERALGFEPDEPASSRLDKLERLMEGKWSRPRLDTHLLARLLSIPCDERYGVLDMTPQRQKEETIRSLREAIETIARQQPTLLLFEDAHWADPTTIEVWDALIDRMLTLPLLIVITGAAALFSIIPRCRQWYKEGPGCHWPALAQLSPAVPDRTPMVLPFSPAKLLVAVLSRSLGKAAWENKAPFPSIGKLACEQ